MSWNILVAIESLAQRGGTETQLFELVSRIDSSRFHLHVCCLEENEPFCRIPPPHTLQVFPLRRINSLGAIQQFARLRSYIQRHKIDIVQTFMFKPSALGVIAAWGTHCQATITCRRNLDFAPGHNRIVRFLNGRTARILANSEAVKAKVVEMEGVSPEKIDVLHNGVDLDRFGRPTNSIADTLARLRIPPGAAVVGMVANLRPIKDIPFFLDAASQVAGQIPEAVFLIVGEGPLRPQLEAYAAELGIREKVFFVGGAVDVADCLGVMKVGCLSSHVEGFSNAILEYMAARLPVVATAVGGNAEAIVHDVTGYLVQERTIDRFARHVIDLLRDEPARTAMGLRGYDRCRRIFDIREVVRKHEEYWMELIQRPVRQPLTAAAAGRA